MKKPFILLRAVVLVAAVSIVVSCSVDSGEDIVDKVPLPSPVVEVQSLDAASFTIVWEEVTGAASYSYRCGWSGETGTVEDTLLSFGGLEAGNAYTVYVASLPSPDASLFLASPETEVIVELPGAATSGNGFTFELVDEPDKMVMNYTVIPDDPDMLFYRDAFTDVQWEDFGGNPEDVWETALAGYISFFGESVLQMIGESGTANSFFSYNYDQSTYMLVAGIDESLNRITPVVDTVFYSGPVPPSDITFDIVVSDVGVSNAVVSVEPSNDDPWSMLMIEGNMEDYSEQDMKDLLKYTYGEYINDGHVYSGYLEMKYGEGTLDPDTEYTVMVFGWNTALSTDIDTVRIRTDKASSSADLTFDWLIEVQGPMEIHAVVTPSDLEAQYIVIPMPDYDYEEFGTDINAYLDYVTMGMITPYEYADMFATTGVTDKVFDEWNDGIYPESSYMFMAVGVDMDNSTQTVEFYSPQTYGEMVTTPSE